MFRDNYQFFYLRALCHKVLKNFDKSDEDYAKIRRAFAITKGKEISMNIFGMLMGPFERNRKKLLMYVNTFESIIERSMN